MKFDVKTICALFICLTVFFLVVPIQISIGG